MLAIPTGLASEQLEICSGHLHGQGPTCVLQTGGAQSANLSNVASFGVLQVDAEGFEAEMAAQRGRSREAVRALDLTAGGNALGDLAGRLGAATAFIGYEHGPLRAQGSVLAILRNGESVESASAGVCMLPAIFPCHAFVCLRAGFG